MLTLDHYRARRDELLSRLEEPTLLFAGGERPRNFPSNHYPYRADSNFLFFFGAPERNAAALFDPDDGSVSLFLPERTQDTALWEGGVPSFEEMRETAGVDRVIAVEGLEEKARELARGRRLLSVAVMDSQTEDRARRVTGLDLDGRDPARIGPRELVDVLAELRSTKNAAELEEMREAADLSRAAFTGAMAASRVGVSERVLVADAQAAFARRGGTAAFPTILSTRGEILHNPHHRGCLREGDLVLMDGGAELPSGYGSDVTRAWPATGRFTEEQRLVYDTVLRAVRAATADVRAGVRFRDVHFRAAHVIVEGLAALGLVKGDAADIVERGAHAVFFPHGVGHLLGLDIHDLESFGDRILYGPGRERSPEFGTRYLRIDLDLKPGMVVTIEPGIYFVPAILHDRELRRQHGDVIAFSRAERFLESNEGRGFGGIRLEEDVVVTDGDPEVLTGTIPLEIEAVEEIVGSESHREVGVRT